MLNGIKTQFELGSKLRFVEHPSGLISGVVSTEMCRGEFFLHGAHVTQFQPAGAQPLLFLSEQTELRADKSIRGGVPLCFPWFGPHPSDLTAAAHGLVRTQNWQLRATSVDADGVVCIELGLSVEQNSHESWQLTFTVRWGQALDLHLEIRNTSGATRQCEVALHTYFALSDVHATSVRGLEQLPYLDKLTGANEQATGQAIRFTQETDRVYHGRVAEVVIDDVGNHREIRLLPVNSLSTVVWNPWIAKSQRMGDFGDDEYLQMCCVETANVGQHRMQIAAGETASIGCNMSCQ